VDVGVCVGVSGFLGFGLKQWLLESDTTWDRDRSLSPFQPGGTPVFHYFLLFPAGMFLLGKRLVEYPFSREEMVVGPCLGSGSEIVVL